MFSSVWPRNWPLVERVLRPSHHLDRPTEHPREPFSLAQFDPQESCQASIPERLEREGGQKAGIRSSLLFGHLACNIEQELSVRLVSLPKEREELPFPFLQD